MAIVLKPDQEKAVREAIDAGLIRSVDELIEAAIGALPRNADLPAWRTDAVRRKREFGEMYKLDLGERISRIILHEGHRY